MLEALGACKAIVRQSSMTARSTGRLQSRRLRTERVVVSSSSGVRGRVRPVIADVIAEFLHGQQRCWRREMPRGSCLGYIPCQVAMVPVTSDSTERMQCEAGRRNQAR